MGLAPRRVALASRSTTPVPSRASVQRLSCELWLRWFRRLRADTLAHRTGARRSIREHADSFACPP
jgi:hypothetical protein